MNNAGSGANRQLVGFVNCGAKKRDLPEGGACAAKDLYTSGYFRDRWSYVERFCERRYILSAKHGILEPDEEIETYDASLKPNSDNYIGDEARREWVARVGTQIRTLRHKHAADEVVMLVSRDYIEPLAEDLEHLVRNGVPVHDPFFDLGGLPGQRKWCNEAVAAGDPMLPEINLGESADEGDGELQTETKDVERDREQSSLEGFA